MKRLEAEAIATPRIVINHQDGIMEDLRFRVPLSRLDSLGSGFTGDTGPPWVSGKGLTAAGSSSSGEHVLSGIRHCTLACSRAGLGSTM